MKRALRPPLLPALLAAAPAPPHHQRPVRPASGAQADLLLAPVKLDKLGYIARSGHYAINPQFDEVEGHCFC